MKIDVDMLENKIVNFTKKTQKIVAFNCPKVSELDILKK